MTQKVIYGYWRSVVGKVIATVDMDPLNDPKVPCTVTTVYDCVSWEIEEMNWIEYRGCIVGAPVCYATLWASCTREVCKINEIY